MRKLFILRHADAALAAPGQPDKLRPLSPVGRREAQVLGEKMKAMKLFPQYVVCSPAKRTRETYAALEGFLPETACVYPEYLYNAGLEELLKAIGGFADTYSSAMIVGHNPGIHALARTLAGDDAGPIAFAYKPCTLTVIDCACESWALLDPAHCSAGQLLTP
jgi:phosphohistidine phosphatase